MFRRVFLLCLLCLGARGVWALSKLTGCDLDLLWLEFTTSEKACKVKERFDNVSVVYGHKVYGVGRYFFVVENDQSDDLKDLTLPSDATLTASVVPVETLYVYLQRLGISLGGERLSDLSGTNLTLVEFTWLAQGLNEAQYRGSMKELISQVKSGPNQPERSTLLVPVGQLPTRFLWYWDQENCATADYIVNILDPLGGPGGVRTRVLKIHSI